MEETIPMLGATLHTYIVKELMWMKLYILKNKQIPFQRWNT